MRIKTGDQVRVRAGKDKGKTGKVIQVFPSLNRVAVEGVNVMTRHLRPSRRGEKGQKVSFSAPLAAANLMVICGKCGKPTRIGARILEDGSRVRICKKCNEAIV